MFEEIDVFRMPFNVFDKIANCWMLITAGDLQNHNTMTASWGGFGVLWFKPCATIYVRPQRYTKEFLDREDFFTLSFYDEKYKEALTFCGRNSGKDVNKDEKINFTPKAFLNSVAYEEADIVFVCKKQFTHQMQPSDFCDKEILEKFYPTKDYSEIFIAEIVKTMIKKN